MAGPFVLRCAFNGVDRVGTYLRVPSASRLGSTWPPEETSTWARRASRPRSSRERPSSCPGRWSLRLELDRKFEVIGARGMGSRGY